MENTSQSPAQTAAHKLPLKMTVRSVRRGPLALEVDVVVVDADGASVKSDSITMNPKSSVAAVCAMLQNHVAVLAQSMHKRGKAAIYSAPDGQQEDDSRLNGAEFIGSVAT